MSKAKLLGNLKEFVIITFGAALAAAGIFFFMIPSNVSIGSGSALAMALANYIPLPISVLSLAINVILLIIGFLTIGTEFGIKTVYASIVVPVCLGILEILFPNFQSLTQDPLLDVLCYVLVVGWAMAVLFSCNASSGGMDIVAKIIHKYCRIELGKAVYISGIAVALISSLCSKNVDAKLVILSVVGTYFAGIIVDNFIFGMNIKRRVCIISPKLDEIVNFILYDLHSGASLNELTGAYDKVQRKEVITIVDKNEYRKLMAFVRKTDPKAFVTVYSVNEIRYQPKTKR
ncbi:MAG: YitT family protein [Clostridia bacterium]|nr:YitT family protein [Clostridia bacterium]